jgi:hypothetical protein
LRSAIDAGTETVGLNAPAHPDSSAMADTTMIERFIRSI